MVRTVACCLLFVVKAVYPRSPKIRKVAKVAPFRGSRIDSIKGIVPMVQSQHKSHGNNNSHKLTLIRWAYDNCLVGVGATEAGLSNLE